MMTLSESVDGSVPAEFEQARLAALESLGLLDTLPERDFDAIVHLAQRLTGSKIALISLIDKDRQWFKAKVGIEVDETPRDLAFCAHAVAADDILIIPDATKDVRFANNPLVTGAPKIRFYMGVPIRSQAASPLFEPLPLGTLCIIDNEPREPRPCDLDSLVELAHLVEALIGAKSAAETATRYADECDRSLQALNRKNRQFRQAERMANMGSWRLTLEDSRTEWSEQTYAIHGVPVGDEKALDAALEFFPPHGRKVILDALEHTKCTGEPFDVETDFHTAQGDYRRVRSMGELEIEDGRPVALIGVFQDITARHMMEEALRHTAHTDDLTRVASRARFNEFVDQKIENSIAASSRCALLLIDLDHFKAINDRFGHHAGDEVLRVMASRLKADYLSSSFAARLGGDEFVLVISDQTALKDLARLLRRLLTDLRYSVSANGLTLHVSATIGASWVGGHINNRGKLLRAADAALYEAKRNQRGSAIIAGQNELILPGQSAPSPLRLVENI